MLSKYYRPATTLVARMALKNIDDCIFEGSVIDRIREHMTNPLFRNAMFLASPDLCRQLDSYLAGEVTDTKKKERIENAFTRYLNRMCTRCTPFGLFAAVGTADVQQDASAIDNTPQQPGLYIDVKMDTQLLERAAERLLTWPDVRKHLRYKVNETAWQNGDYIKYINYYQLKDRRIHRVEKAELSPYLEKIIACQRESLDFAALKQALLSFDDSLADDEMEEYIHELISARVLVSEFNPPLTGTSFHDHFKQLLLRLQTQVTETACFDTIDHLLQIITQAEAIGIDTNLENAITQLAEQLAALGIHCDPVTALHIDTYFSEAPMQVHRSVINDVIKGVELLSHFSLPAENKMLDQFKKQFETTYSGRPMPLPEVLDAETGIGYPVNNVKLNAQNQLLEEINPPQPGRSDTMEISWNKSLHSFWLRKYIDCLSRGEREIEITEEEATQFPGTLDKMPPTFNVHFSLHPVQNNESGASPYLIQFTGWGGVSATNMMTRFAHAHPGILALCHEAAATEEKALSPGEVLADICHVPDGSIINLLSRPQLRRYEIAYLAGTSLTGDNMVMPADLSVYIKNKKVYLYSNHLQKIVKPVLSCAHNYRKSEHPVYTFLCDVQKQGFVNGVHLNLGRWVDEVDFFPRVRYRNMILVPASWRLKQQFFAGYLAGRESLDSVRERMMKKLGPVTAFLVEEGDNELYVHTDCTHHWKMFLNYVKKTDDIIIKEFIRTPAQQTANQLVLTFFKTDARIQLDRENNESLLNDLKPKREKAVFYPGSEWLYVKLYTNPNHFDTLLATDIRALLNAWSDRTGMEPDYFFVKYYDTGHHLRWRIKTSEVLTAGELLHDIQAYFNNRPAGITSMLIDTYVRECERYAPAAYNYIEQFFCTDARLVMDFLCTSQEPPNDVNRLLFALRHLEQYLTYFGFNNEQALRFCRNVRSDFAAYFNVDLHLKKQLGRKCRELDLLNRPTTNMPSTGDIQEKLRRICTDLELHRVPDARREEIIWSLLHMHVNRLFNYQQRFYELIVYDFLEKRFDSRIARMKTVKSHL
jgi:thiopeptide-type bacteriocin biosynthesis protein